MTTNWGELSAKALITKLKAKKEVRSVLLRHQASTWTCRLLVTKLFGPYSACFIGHDTLQHTCLNKPKSVIRKSFLSFSNDRH